MLQAYDSEELKKEAMLITSGSKIRLTTFY